MEVFSTILTKLIPLYGIIFLGFIAGKHLDAKKETIAKLLIYIITPAIIFYGAYTAPITIENLSLPIIFFILCCLISTFALGIGNLIFKKDKLKNIFAFTSGTGNTGYFGLPVTLAIFGDSALSIVVLAILGFVLYENTLGFYITAKGNHSGRDSLYKVLKLPTVYAFFLGLLVNYLNLDLGDLAVSTIENFKGAYTLLGMMMIGMGLATVKLHHVDFKFLSATFVSKFFVWPLVVGAIILLDNLYIGALSQEIHSIMIVMSVVPLAANTVALATELNVHPDKAAVAVLCSTMFALFYIPLVTMLFIKL